MPTKSSFLLIVATLAVTVLVACSPSHDDGPAAPPAGPVVQKASVRTDLESGPWYGPCGAPTTVIAEAQRTKIVFESYVVQLSEEGFNNDKCEGTPTQSLPAPSRIYAIDFQDAELAILQLSSVTPAGNDLMVKTPAERWELDRKAGKVTIKQLDAYGKNISIGEFSH